MISTNPGLRQQTRAQLLYCWYKVNARDLPWRNQCDPYFTLVSEFMLQQTRVEAVIPKFLQFVQSKPTLKDLAQSSLEEVRALWRGLGYYRRCLNLWECAKRIFAMGRYPRELNEWKALPGMGDYTSRAMMSIGFHQPVSVFDGNVLRITSRIFALPVDGSRALGRKLLVEMVDQHLFLKEFPSDSNQAMMELGALICTPKSPKCQICPLSTQCEANRLGKQEEFPIVTAALEREQIKLSVLLDWDVQSSKPLYKEAWRGYQSGYLFPYWVEGAGNFANAVHVGSFKHAITRYKLTVDVYVRDFAVIKEYEKTTQNASTLLLKAIRMAVIYSRP